MTPSHSPRAPGLRRAALATLLMSAMTAQAVTLVGLTSSNEIARLDTADIGAATRTAITGLDAGDRFVGIDLRPSNNLIYGITLNNRLYTVDEFSGAATFVAALSMPVVDGALGYGIDFNPVADYAGAASLRFVSSAGANLAINASTGTVGNSAGTLAAGYTAVAYTNSNPLSAAPASTALYYIDSNSDTLAMAPGAFNAPTIATVGPLGIDVLQANGFEVLGNGMGFAALNVDAGTSLTTGIYGIDLATGAANPLGVFNGTLSGLTVSAVPEPGTWALMLAGLAAVGGLAKRRRA